MINLKPNFNIDNMMVKKICMGLVFLFMNCLVTMGQETLHHQEKLIMTGDSLLNSFHIYEAMSYYEEAYWKMFLLSVKIV